MSKDADVNIDASEHISDRLQRQLNSWENPDVVEITVRVTYVIQYPQHLHQLETPLRQIFDKSITWTNYLSATPKSIKSLMSRENSEI